KIGRWWKLYWLYGKYRPQIEQLRAMTGWIDDLMKHKGFYDSRSFYNWIRDRLSERGKLDQNGQVTFGSVGDVDPVTAQPRGTILKIVATDLATRKHRLYQIKDFAGIEIAEAVHASMSLPLIFRPFEQGKNYLVDGGLVSNFPAWAFDTEKKTQGDLPVL